MEQTILQIAVQVPALFIMGVVFLKVLGMVLDMQGKKLDRLADAIERRTAGP